MFSKKLLLLALCVCGAEAVSGCVSQGQLSGSVSLQWEIPSEMASMALGIICDQDPSDPKELPRLLYFQSDDREDQRSQSPHFRGRVRAERVGLSRGLFRVNISDVRAEDSGSYECIFFNGGGRYTNVCLLCVAQQCSQAPGPTPETISETTPETISETREETTQETTEETTVTPPGGSRGRAVLYAALILGLLALGFIIFIFLRPTLMTALQTRRMSLRTPSRKSSIVV